MAAYDLTVKGSGLEFDTSDASYPALAKLSDTRVMVAYMTSAKLKVQCYDIDPSTGAITAAGTSSVPAFSLSTGENPIALLALSSTRVFAIYSDGSDCYCEIFDVDGSGNVSSPDSETKVTTNRGNFHCTPIVIDSTHVLVAFRGMETNHIRLHVIAHDGNGVTGITSTDTSITNISDLGIAKIAGTTKAILTYIDSSTSDAFARVISVDPSTYAITVGTAHEFYDSATVSEIAVDLVNETGTPVAVCAMKVTAGASTGVILQALSIDTGANTVSSLGSRYQLNGYTTAVAAFECIKRIDDTHMLLVMQYTAGAGRAETVDLNTSTGAMSNLQSQSFGATQTVSITLLAINRLFLSAYQGASNDGFFTLLDVEPNSTSVTVSVAAPLAATFSLPASTVTAIQNATISPSALAATFSTPAPAITGGASIASSVLSATFSIPLVDVYTPDALVSPSALTATFDAPDPTVVGEANVSQGTPLSATFSIPASAVAIGADISAGVLTATFTLQAPVVTAEQSVTASAGVLEATFSLPASGVEIGQLIEPSPLTATFTIPAFTVTAERYVTVDASVLVATFSLVRPRKMGGAWSPQPREVGDWTAQPRTMG